MKLIAIVRDPIARTISDFTQLVDNHRAKNLTLRVANFFASAFTFNATEPLNTQYKPILNSLYAQHFRHWLSRFSQEQIHLVDGDRFRVDPLYEVCNFSMFSCFAYLQQASILKIENVLIK